MRTRIVKLVRWLVGVTGRLARRILGAIVAATLVFVLLILLLIFGGDRLPFADSGIAVRILFSGVVTLVGTLVMALAGFVWPGPPLGLLRILDCLPETDIDLFDFD